jgi:hypothetical protein
MRFWRRNRTDYFTLGLTDGKKAASSSVPTVALDTAQVREHAQVASAALVGRVAHEASRIYQSGWVEGYSITHTLQERALHSTDTPVA